MNYLKENIKAHTAQIAVFAITIIGAIIIGGLAVKFIPTYEDKTEKIDTVKIPVVRNNRTTDSLLQDIDNQVHAINNKLSKPKAKVRYLGKHSRRNDTIKIDASVRLSKQDK
mgnify:FL=1